MFISAITEAELRDGLALLPYGQRQRRPMAQAEAMLSEDFAGRILPFDSAAAKAYAPPSQHGRSRTSPNAGLLCSIPGLDRGLRPMRDLACTSMTDAIADDGPQRGDAGAEPHVL
jgi:toxin FitB